jgi:hypothetical protein
MKIFNYIYYRVTSFYKQFKGGDEYFLMGVIIVSILQFLNLIVLLAFSSQYSSIIKRLFFNLKHENNKIFFLLFVTVLLIYNYFIYTKYMDYDQLTLKWKVKSNKVYRRFNMYTILYILVSIILLILSSKFILIKI